MVNNKTSDPQRRLRRLVRDHPHPLKRVSLVNGGGEI
jgi:hypothetical protein